MPTVSYNKKELRKLIGKHLSDQQLADAIALVKPNLEAVQGDDITIEHTADRADLFGIEGLARSVQNYLGMKKGLSKYTLWKPKMRVKMSSIPVRPYVSCAVVRNVKMDKGFFESVINIQEMLNESLGRKRQRAAIGIHDFDKIKGTVSYQGASRDEEMVPLESQEKMSLRGVMEKTEKGKDYAGILKSAKILPVFKDSGGIISFPPILNSDRTKVTEETKNFFVEVTGTDKQVVRQVMAVLVSNFAHRKFSLESVKLQFEKKSTVTPDMSEEVMEISLSNVNKTLGLELTTADIRRLLSRMGYDVLGPAEKMQVVVPSWRSDILHPVDIMEDIAIAHGYNNMKPELPNMATIGKPLEIEKLCEGVKMSLNGFGFQEILSSSLSNKKDLFEKMHVPENRLVEIENPSSQEYSCVRSWMLPGVMKFLSANKHYEYPQNVFEIGDVVIRDRSEQTLARNERRVAGAVCHSKAGFVEIKTIIESLAKSLGMGYTTKPYESDLYIPGRAVDMYVGDEYFGTFGEVHPRVLNEWGIDVPVAAFEIVLEDV